jgi:hypothetical protein
VKEAFDSGIDRLAARLGKLMPRNAKVAGGKKAAMALLGEMAGALTVSRAIADIKQSNALLAAARKGVLAG